MHVGIVFIYPYLGMPTVYIRGWISNLGANAILPVGCWSTVFLVVFHSRNSVAQTRPKCMHGFESMLMLIWIMREK